MTHTGESLTAEASVSGLAKDRGLGVDIGSDFACERNSNAAPIQLNVFYVKAT
jgi:hypothetical protein